MLDRQEPPEHAVGLARCLGDPEGLVGSRERLRCFPPREEDSRLDERRALEDVGHARRDGERRLDRDRGVVESAQVEERLGHVGGGLEALGVVPEHEVVTVPELDRVAEPGPRPLESRERGDAPREVEPAGQERAIGRGRPQGLERVPLLREEGGSVGEGRPGLAPVGVPVLDARRSRGEA